MRRKLFKRTHTRIIMDLNQHSNFQALIDHHTNPTSLASKFPSRWKPRITLAIDARSIEGMPAYNFALKGRVGQSDPWLLGKFLFGDNLPMCYEVDLVGIKWGLGTRTNLLSLGFPSDWPAWSPPQSQVRRAYEFDNSGLDTTLLNAVHVRIVGTQFGTNSNPLFAAEFVYSLEKFNKDAGYEIPLNFA